MTYQEKRKLLEELTGAPADRLPDAEVDYELFRELENPNYEN